MVMDMLTIYLHYEDENQEAHILQRSMMRRRVSHYDFILMMEEVGFDTIDFLYYAKKDPQDNAYFVQIEDQSGVIKMLSDPEIEKTAQLYVSKEKATNDIAPSDHPNESVLLQDGGVSSKLGELLTARSSHEQLRRSKRLNVIQITDQHNDEDEDFNNGEQYITPGAESQALEHDNVNQLLIQQKSSSALGPVIDSVPEVTVTTEQLDESSTRLNQQGMRSKHPQSAPSKRRTSSLQDGSRVVLKTSTYPNKRNIAYATIRSTNPATKAGGIELGAEFALVRIDEPIIQNEELVMEVGDCKTIGDDFSKGFLIAWRWAFI